MHNQRQYGYLQGYLKAYKEWRAYDYYYKIDNVLGRSFYQVINYIDREFWGYGYEKLKIIKLIGVLFFIFFFINIFWLRKRDALSYHVYVVLIYTFTIFFAPYIDRSKATFQEEKGIIYIGVQYLVGKICLIYLLNALFIGSKELI